VSILGVAIGAAVAMVAVTRAVIVERLPVVDQDRLAVLWPYRDATVEVPIFQADVDRLRREAKQLLGVAAYTHWGANATPYRDGDRALVLNRTIVTGNYFTVLGTTPALGRLLRGEDGERGAPGVAVLSYGAWRRNYGGSPAVVGHRLIDAYTLVPRTVVGVAPPGLDFPRGTDVWTNDVVWDFPAIAIARLAPGATVRSAAVEFFSLVRPFNPARPLVGATGTSFPDLVIGDVRRILWVLTAAVALLFTIACVNVGTLLLVRAGERQRELLVRRALGASAGAIVGQLVVEALALAVAGGALGIVMARMLLGAIAALGPSNLPRLDALEPAGLPLGLSIGATLAAVLLFGVLPAVVTARMSLGPGLRLDARAGGSSGRSRRSRELLAAVQVALALALLTASALVVRTFHRLATLDLGYRHDRLSILQISGPVARYSGASRLRALGAALAPPIRSLPGVVGLTPILEQPFNGVDVWRWKFDAEGQSASDREHNPLVPIEVGGAEFLSTLGVPLVRGRGFLESDREGSELVALVTESVARRFWPGQDPVGKRVRVPGSDGSVTRITGEPGDSGWRTVVGVVRELHLRSLREGTPTVYLPWQQSYWQGTFAIRTTGSLAGLLPSIRRAVHEVDPDLLLWEAKTLDEMLAEPLARPKLTAALLSGFGLIALVLSGIGLYGVMATLVRERTHEIGVRMALGANAGRVRADILRKTFLIVGAGAVVGLAIALASSRLLTALLFQIAPNEPLAILAATGLLLLVALVAGYGPARRATRVDPIEALRAD
jgi:predicted permease